MSIDFSTKIDGRYYSFKNVACWIHICRSMETLLRGGLARDGMGNAIRLNPRLDEDGAPVPGVFKKQKARLIDRPSAFSVRVDLYQGTQYYKSTCVADRLLYDKMFDDLFAGWFTEGQVTSVYHKVEGWRRSIEFHDSIPFFVMASVASVYRLHWDAHTSLHQWWEWLDRFDLNPWTKYYIASFMGTHHNASKDWDNEPLQCAPEKGHMPFDPCRGRYKQIKHMRSISAHTFRDMRTSRDEYQRTRKLSCDGRDDFFSPIERKESYWLEKLAKKNKLSVITHHGSDYYHYDRIGIYLAKLIEQVIIPAEREGKLG